MTETDSRPDPDELLSQLKAEEERKKRAKLKIFLGYAAGVGKTYTMLGAARQLSPEQDVVVAHVETHGRAETEALLDGLEIIPSKDVGYRGIQLSEMDIDSVLARRPMVALVDELAHTNAPNSRHPKRYQDVEELLEAGIDVYTTLNVQHIESLRNVLMQITGVWQKETVPDSMLDKATDIELVDIPPDELLKRFREGKVYVPDQTALATKQFFRKGNLTALRQLAMQVAADRVEEQKQAYMQTHAIHGSWPTAERILVSVGSGPLANGLVRSARRLAARMGAEWFAIHVETPDDAQLTPEERERIAETLRLAEQMGAKVATIPGHSVAETLIEYAKKNKITRIMLGSPRGSRLRNLVRGSVVDRIIRQSKGIDVHVVADWVRARPQYRLFGKVTLGPARSCLQGVTLVAAATLIGKLVYTHVELTNIAMIYIASIVVTAVFWGLGASLLASILSAAAFDFFFVPPYGTFTVNNTQYILTFIVLLGVGMTISYLSWQMRQQARVAQRKESESAILCTLSRSLTMTAEFGSVVRTVTSGTRQTLGRDAAIFLSDPQSPHTLKAFAADRSLSIDDRDIAAANWSFEHRKIVGLDTDTLPNARARYLPLNTARGVIGVMALYPSGISGKSESKWSRPLEEAYADLVALAIERIQLAEQARNAEVLAAKEGLEAALLNSISHDLRTPLASIIGVLSSLQEEGLHLDDAARKNLIEVASGEAERLNHLVTNLLDMSRIEAGSVRLLKQSSDLQDIISVALDQAGINTGDRQINVDLSGKLPLISVDFRLITQVIVNILDNAVKYTPPNSSIEITGQQTGQQIQIAIADRGTGIPAEDLKRVFDKFYRVHRADNVIGTGLGLSICKGIIEAHGGRIWAENNPGGGTIIKFTLPLDESIAQNEE